MAAFSCGIAKFGLVYFTDRHKHFNFCTLQNLAIHYHFDLSCLNLI